MISLDGQTLTRWKILLLLHGFMKRLRTLGNSLFSCNWKYSLSKNPWKIKTISSFSPQECRRYSHRCRPILKFCSDSPDIISHFSFGESIFAETAANHRCSLCREVMN